MNILLLGSSNKKREIGEKKALRAIRLVDQEDAKKSEDRVPLKVWKMMIPGARISKRSSEEVNIGLVKDSSTNMDKPGGGKMSQQNKKSRAKFLQPTQAEGKKNDATYMKSVDGFIKDCSGPS